MVILARTLKNVSSFAAYKGRERKKIALGVAVGGVGSIMIVAAIVWLILFKNRTKNRAINRGSVEMDGMIN